MSQIWKENEVIPVTIVRAAGNKVSLVRTKDKDGYVAVRLDFEGKKKEFRNKPGFSYDAGQFQVGGDIGVDSFKEGDLVMVSGLKKGKGFQGVVKRHGFGGGPKTHGQKNRFRAPGSIGSTAPQRVFPGRKMAGHMGAERETVKNLKIVGIDKDNGFLFIKGAVPGARGGLLEIRK
ncbi:MAG: 50S ribosomal protein L3 [Patescibacteria group bacterium]